MSPTQVGGKRFNLPLIPVLDWATSWPKSLPVRHNELRHLL
ncbi:hypothetical protein A2U01_0103075, partial [Trifolium medium]|nr:hypothetical protein [Trifolium medium]